ncbi:[protein-PII] uridylyltransferase [Radicibacter daui]|uniref:[protein-PII] uridylyltransferase n=1 Tax=Radicibacter daui TaxID=3064829 RepID=UPI004046A66E
MNVVTTRAPRRRSTHVARPASIVDVALLNGALDGVAASEKNPEARRKQVLEVLREYWKQGRAEIAHRLETGTSGGPQSTHETTFLVDNLVQAIYRFATTHAYPLTNPTTGELFCIVATGGYGRGEMAPESDVDLLFLLPYKRTSSIEQVVEFILYLLWDLGPKVGHAVRTVEECLKQARKDLTISTALLEARYIAGHQPLFTELRKRYDKEIMQGGAANFIRDKLLERDERHQRFGDSRYVLEPNIKEAKGGLRDLHTLFWIAKFTYRADNGAALVEKGVFTPEESQRFEKAADFLWTVRCQLHALTGRAEDRLTFDVQKTIADRLHYTDHAGTQGVERFMKHYFLIAKDVGDLTRVLCAHLESETKRAPRLSLLRRSAAQSEIDGFANEGGRLSVRNDRHFKDEPRDMIRLFWIMHRDRLDIHPTALRLISRDLKNIGNKVRNDPEANRWFVDILTSEQNPMPTLRAMNEAGVLGRFIPDFGRVVAQMQYDMYHCYTVDEHTLIAVSNVHDIEKGSVKDELPLATKLFEHIREDKPSRRALYAAMFLHDIAKGRGGDHSILGARVARKICPRWGFTPEETETVAWLVRWHLAMSDAALKRDLEDPKTIADMATLVRSPQRLRLLLILTACDIRAVGPGRWNAWKATLLRQMFNQTNDYLTGNLSQETTDRRVASVQAEAAELLLAEKGDSPWTNEQIEKFKALGYPGYWLSFPARTLAQQAGLIRKAERSGERLAVDVEVHQRRGVSTVTVYTQDHAGLFNRLAGAIAASGASIVDARIFTFTNGMALDVFTIQDVQGEAPDGPQILSRLPEIIEKTLEGRLRIDTELAKRRQAMRSKSRLFATEPRVLIDNTASKNFTVIEVNGRDRIGLLYELTRALTRLNIQIGTAKIGTWGTNVVDVFYVRDVFGMKIAHEGKLNQVRSALEEVLADPVSETA